MRAGQDAGVRRRGASLVAVGALCGAVTVASTAVARVALPRAVALLATLITAVRVRICGSLRTVTRPVSVLTAAEAATNLRRACAAASARRARVLVPTTAGGRRRALWSARATPAGRIIVVPRLLGRSLVAVGIVVGRHAVSSIELRGVRVAEHLELRVNGAWIHGGVAVTQIGAATKRVGRAARVCAGRRGGVGVIVIRAITSKVTGLSAAVTRICVVNSGAIIGRVTATFACAALWQRKVLSCVALR